LVAFAKTVGSMKSPLPLIFFVPPPATSFADESLPASM
jgi:hypothetical protein